MRPLAMLLACVLLLVPAAASGRSLTGGHCDAVTAR